MEKQSRRIRYLIPSPRPRSQAPSLPSPARSSSKHLTLAAAAADAADAGAPSRIQTAQGMAQDQQQPWGAAAPPLLFPLPARRIITADDVLKAYPAVEKKWIPIRDCVPPVEDMYFKYKKETDDTGDEDANLVKRQVINGCNSLGNKRREICYYLPSKKRYEALITRLGNELQGLEHQLAHRIADFRTFMPDNPFEMPDHFMRYPELMKPVPKKAKATKRK